MRRHFTRITATALITLVWRVPGVGESVALLRRVAYLDIGNRKDEWIRLKHGPIAVDVAGARLTGLDTGVVAATPGSSPESPQS